MKKTTKTKTPATHSQFKLRLTSEGFEQLSWKSGDSIEYPTLTHSRLYDLLANQVGGDGDPLSIPTAVTVTWANDKAGNVVDVTVRPSFGTPRLSGYSENVRVTCRQIEEDLDDAFCHEAVFHFVLASLIYAVRVVARDHGLIK